MVAKDFHMKFPLPFWFGVPFLGETFFLDKTTSSVFLLPRRCAWVEAPFWDATASSQSLGTPSQWGEQTGRENPRPVFFFKYFFHRPTQIYLKILGLFFGILGFGPEWDFLAFFFHCEFAPKTGVTKMTGHTELSISGKHVIAVRRTPHFGVLSKLGQWPWKKKLQLVYFEKERMGLARDLNWQRLCQTI